MTRDEYEARRRRIEAELQAGMELLQASAQAQLRALEMVWMSASGEPATTPAPSSRQPATPAPPPKPPDGPVHRRLAQVRADVAAALPRLPGTFDRNHVREAIGYEPNRVALFRVLNDLVAEGALGIEMRGGGQRPTTYRRNTPRASGNTPET